jgi:hypothetical protein
MKTIGCNTEREGAMHLYEYQKAMLRERLSGDSLRSVTPSSEGEPEDSQSIAVMSTMDLNRTIMDLTLRVNEHAFLGKKLDLGAMQHLLGTAFQDIVLLCAAYQINPEEIMKTNLDDLRQKQRRRIPHG